MCDVVRVAQEAGKLIVSIGTFLVPRVKGHVSGGLLLTREFLDADTLVPCTFFAEPVTENFQHQVLTSLPLRKNPGTVSLMNAKALQRQQLWRVGNAVFGTQTSCHLYQFSGFGRVIVI